MEHDFLDLDDIVDVEDTRPYGRDPFDILAAKEDGELDQEEENEEW